MKTSIICAAAVSALLLCACHPKEQPEHVDKQQGRDETQGIRNTEAIGYSGNAIGDKVDAALDANDQAKQRLDAAEAEQTQ